MTLVEVGDAIGGEAEKITNQQVIGPGTCWWWWFKLVACLVVVVLVDGASRRRTSCCTVVRVVVRDEECLCNGLPVSDERR
jgi:hypothetical protein